MMRAVCGVYPPAKLLGTFLVEGFNSKNNRSRVECMEECAAMIDTHGIEHTKGVKVLPALVELVGSKEAAIRSTALNVLAAVYKHVGADVWGMMGKCSDVKVCPLTRALTLPGTVNSVFVLMRIGPFGWEIPSVSRRPLSL
jgi:hypothetical protein